MSLQTLQILTLLVIALTVYGNNINGDDLSDLLLGDVDKTKYVNQNGYGTTNTDEILEDLKERTLTKPTLPPPIYRPTPPTIITELPIVTKDPPAILLPEKPEISLTPITLPEGQPQPIKPAQVTSPVVTVGQPHPIKPAQVAAGQPHPIKPAQVAAGQPQPIKPAQVTAGQPQPIKPAGTSTVIPADLPIIIPPQRPSEPTFTVPICGKKQNCYQWFDHAIELTLGGYNRCNARDERRAKRYCCIP